MANNNHFELTLDTLAPSGSISRGDQRYHNTNYALTIVKDDASWMYVWRDTTAVPTAIPTGLEPIEAATSYTTDFDASAEEYYHLVLEDSVGNQSPIYSTEIITFDIINPVVTDDETAYLADTDSGSKLFTNDPVVNFHFVATDNLSGIVSGRIVPISGSMAGQVVVVPVGGEFSGTITLTGDDGTKQVAFYATDGAGNESDPVTREIYLDTHLDAPILTIHNAVTDANISTMPVNYGTAAGEILARITTESDVVNYKLWKESETEPTEWTPFTGTPTEVTGVVYMDIAKTVTVGDGQKNFYIRVQDQAGTVYPAPPAAAVTTYITLDQTAPVISLTRTGAEWISNITGHTASELTLSATDATAGVASWELLCNGSKVQDGTTTIPTTVAITSATTGMVEGANTFTFNVWDAATNESTATAVVKLDTTGPVVSIGSLNQWYNEFKNQKSTGGNALTQIVANNTDAGAGVDTITPWTSTVAADTTAPAAATPIARTGDAQIIPAANIYGDAAESAANYMHIKVVDKVGNVSYAHQVYGFDSVQPLDNGSKFDKDYYNVKTAQVNLAYTDATSLVAYFKVTGTDIDNPSTDWEAIAATRAVTLNGDDGMKTVHIQFKDNAGNISVSVDATTELDQTAPAALHELHVAGSDDPKPAVSNIKTFDAWISCTDDAIETGGFTFKYYGEGIGKAEAEVEWETFVPGTKKIGERAAMVLSKTCTDGDGLKEMYVKFKDAAGNISEATKASFTLDTTAPEPEAKDVDYNRISKVHVTRRDGAGAGTKYADETCFTLDPKCTMQAYKVCAYKTQAAAEAGSHEDPAIPTTAGSINMSGSGLHTSATVSCKIKGADYETALGGSGNDGLHIVVVYVQDEGGNWSGKAVFTI